MDQTVTTPRPQESPAPKARRPRSGLHVSQRAHRTNDPLALPATLSLKTSQGRRWRDLTVTYAEQLGDRMEREDVRTRVSSLVWVTTELERLHDARMAGKPANLHTILHMTQEQRTLIAELGLSDPPSETGPGLDKYLERAAVK